MAIKTGRYGSVHFEPSGAGSPSGAVVISLNTWKLSQKKDMGKVTCFGDTNHVYVPGLPDISGNITGFWNAAADTLWDAVESDTAGVLDLIPNSQEPTFYWSGPAWFDGDIDCSVEGPPKCSFGFMAAGAWDRLP